MRTVSLVLLSLAGSGRAEPRYPKAIVGSVELPWREDWSFDEPLFVQHIHKELTLTKHIYLFGTAGEGYALTDAMFKNISTIYAREMKKAGALETAMLSVISLSLPTIRERIEWASSTLGIQTFQLSLPSWGALTDDEVRTFFQWTAGAFPALKFWHYNNVRAKRQLNSTLYAELSSKHPNFVGVKTCINDVGWLEQVARAAPDLRLVPNEQGFALAPDWIGAGETTHTWMRSDMQPCLPLLRTLDEI